VATFLLVAIGMTTVAAALAGRRGRTHGVFYWRGLRNVTIAALVFWATFTDGTVIRVIGLVATALLLGLAGLQLSMVRKVQQETP
jgi:hypothetical protein